LSEQAWPRCAQKQFRDISETLINKSGNDPLVTSAPVSPDRTGPRRFPKTNVPDARRPIELTDIDIDQPDATPD